MLAGIAGVVMTVASGMHNAKMMQREDPNIISERDGVFVPLFNDLIYQGINPFGYQTGPKIKDFIPNVIFGRELKVPAREDAWRLYLGKPQLNNTFSVSKFSPKGSNETCYAINDYFDSFLSYGDPADQIRQIHDDQKRGRKVISGDFGVMGGYRIEIDQDEEGKRFIYYYDIWDLNVPLERDGGFLGKPFTIYDRLYFDENTYKPERSLKPVSTTEEVTRM